MVKGVILDSETMRIVSGELTDQVDIDWTIRPLSKLKKVLEFVVFEDPSLFPMLLAHIEKYDCRDIDFYQGNNHIDLIDKEKGSLNLLRVADHYFDKNGGDVDVLTQYADRMKYVNIHSMFSVMRPNGFYLLINDSLKEEELIRSVVKILFRAVGLDPDSIDPAKLPKNSQLWHDIDHLVSIACINRANLADSDRVPRTSGSHENPAGSR